MTKVKIIGQQSKEGIGRTRVHKKKITKNISDTSLKSPEIANLPTIPQSFVDIIGGIFLLIFFRFFLQF